MGLDGSASSTDPLARRASPPGSSVDREEGRVIFVGIDWAEGHHDVCVLGEGGDVLAKGRVPDGVEGLARLHAMVAEHAEEPGEVVIGIETDRGLFVGALVAAGYSELAEAVKVLARAHQSLIWARQRQVNALRSTLREFYPAALRALPELGTVEACSILGMAPTPERGRRLTLAKVRRSLAASGRKRNLDSMAKQIHEVLQATELEPSPVLSEAYGAVVGSLVVVIDGLVHQIVRLEGELAERFERHPDAEILRSLPGLGLVLGARVLAELGDDPTRYADAKARKSYAGTAPITRASGKRLVVLARVARNKRLADACYLWAFSALRTSTGARRYYETRRAAGKTHHQALRALANRLVGVLHGCLQHRQPYREDVAWPTGLEAVA